MSRVAILFRIATLKLDPARARPLGLFMENYLELTAAQVRLFNQQLEKSAPKEKEIVMETMPHWEKRE